MKKSLFVLMLVLSACKAVTTPQEAAKGPPAGGGPPPPPPYQMRAEMPSGDRLVSGRSGEALFTNRCGSCHLAGGMGTNLLTKQRMMAGQPSETGMLAHRTDLTADYVKAVVRQGKVAMPRLSRTEVTDAELNSIATYLGKGNK